MSDKTVNIIIDGVEIQAEEGRTVLQAAEDAGIYIPRLCFLQGLAPGGHCRVCTVKINGRPASSCTYPVSEGLVIENNTEEMTTLRRNVVEMLFAEGNHICPSCEASGDCELQAMAYRLGMLAVTVPFLWQPREMDATHPDVFVDRDRCILCGRCARASIAEGKRVFGFEGRGAHKRIAVDGAHGLKETDLEAVDKAAEACPTGCLRVKRTAWKVPVGQRRFDNTPIGSDIEQKQSAG